MGELIWYAGIYSRLSVDKCDKKNESIDVQIQIAKEYIDQFNNIELVECYSDLGKTGTNFAREEFERMMSDVRQNKINCVIVKDLSRFGRNYIETGNYIEKIFPFFNVRFISVTDDYDSHRNQGTNDHLGVNLKNIVNELYARDCADKVRTIKKSKLEQGCYIGGIPSYGYYAKWVNGKKILFPEEGTSDVVKKIYELFDNGKKISEIISYLHGQRIHRPKEYRCLGHVYCEEGEVLKQWSDTTIHTILTNHVYIGTLVQIRIDGKVCRGRGRRDIEPEEVIMVEHTHEPIIDDNTFYRISSIIEDKGAKEIQRKKQPQSIALEDIYKDLIYCGECGHKLKRIGTSNPKSYSVAVKTYSYGCPHIGRIDGLKCDNHYLALNTLNKIVRETLQKEFDLSGISAKRFVEFNRKQAEKMKANAKKRQKEIQAKLQGTDIEMSSLYMKYRAGEIDKKLFLDQKAAKEALKNNLKTELLQHQTDELHIDKKAEEVNHFIRCLWRGKKSAALDRQMVQCLIKKIILYKDRSVEIIFNFSKEQFLQYKEGAKAR